jgi:Uma2 family endonuclease
MTEAEYLAFEDAAATRHELVNGELVARSGTSPAHGTIQVNLIAAIRNGLRGSTCRVHASDLRVMISETGLYAYPDLSIVCGKPTYSDHNPPALQNPRVLIEVLSDSTENYDLGAKAAHYRRRQSVDLLVFVDSRVRRVSLQSRNPDGTWTLSEQEAGDVRLLDLLIPFDEIYDGVEFA